MDSLNDNESWREHIQCDTEKAPTIQLVEETPALYGSMYNNIQSLENDIAPDTFLDKVQQMIHRAVDDIEYDTRSNLKRAQRHRRHKRREIGRVRHEHELISNTRHMLYLTSSLLACILLVYMVVIELRTENNIAYGSAVLDVSTRFVDNVVAVLPAKFVPNKESIIRLHAAAIKHDTIDYVTVSGRNQDRDVVWFLLLANMAALGLFVVLFISSSVDFMYLTQRLLARHPNTVWFMFGATMRLCYYIFIFPHLLAITMGKLDSIMYEADVRWWSAALFSVSMLSGVYTFSLLFNEYVREFIRIFTPFSLRPVPNK